MPQRKKKTNFQFKFHKKLSIALGIVIILIVLISIPAYATYKSGLATYREAKLIAAAAKDQKRFRSGYRRSRARALCQPGIY